MLPLRKGDYLVKGLVWNCCILWFLLLVTLPESGLFAESKRLKTRHHKTRNYRETDFPYSDGRRVQKGRFSQEISKHGRSHGKHQRHFSSKSRKNVRMDRIRHEFIDIPQLSKLLNPTHHKLNLNQLVSSSSNLMLSGTVRRRRLYCRGGIGYHLEILPNGKVVGRHKPSRYGILKIFSVSMGIVGIQGEANKRYLCMNKKGRLYSSRDFAPECQFREKIEANNFNTYASNSYSDHNRRKGYYLALTKKGKVKSNKKVSAWQKRSHWLPRNITT